MFTEVLLEGLRGKAKVYDHNEGNYVVKIGRLFSFIKNEVPKRAALALESASQLPGRGGTQQIVELPALPYMPQPYISGSVPDRPSDPELNRISADLVTQEPLAVYVEPISVVPGVSIEAWRQERNHIILGEQKSIQNLEDLPVNWSLPPREYYVMGTARGHVLLEGLAVDLYQPCEGILRFSSI